jgi:hypothetical protein
MRIKKRFLGIEPAGLKSWVDPLYKLAGKLLSFILFNIVLHMYLGDYVQESVHGRDPVTPTCGHNCAKEAPT